MDRRKRTLGRELRIDAHEVDSIAPVERRPGRRCRTAERADLSFLGPTGGWRGCRCTAVGPRRYAARRRRRSTGSIAATDRTSRAAAVGYPHDRGLTISRSRCPRRNARHGPAHGVGSRCAESSGAAMELAFRKVMLPGRRGHRLRALDTSDVTPLTSGAGQRTGSPRHLRAVGRRRARPCWRATPSPWSRRRRTGSTPIAGRFLRRPIAVGHAAEW